MPTFSYDPEKSAGNEARRALPFAAAERFEWGTALVVEDTRRDYGERRFQALGLLDGRLHMLVFTPRGTAIHVISLRRANLRERTLHADPTES